MFTLSSCKDIGIRKLEVVAKTNIKVYAAKLHIYIGIRKLEVVAKTQLLTKQN